MRYYVTPIVFAEALYRSLNFHYYFEKAVESGVVLHLQPDGIGKIDLAEYFVGAGGVGRGVPADGGRSIRADRDCSVEPAGGIVRICKRNVLGPYRDAVAVGIVLKHLVVGGGERCATLDVVGEPVRRVRVLNNGCRPVLFA